MEEEDIVCSLRRRRAGAVAHRVGVTNLLDKKLDVEGTYPNVEIICNISKQTTACEIIKIEGVDERIQRSIGINLTGGHVNAVEICTRVYKAPTFDTLLSDYMAAKEGRRNEENVLEWIDDFSGEELDEEGVTSE